MIDQLYKKIQKELTVTLLKELASTIIDAYREKKSYILNDYAVRQDLDIKNLGISKIFAKLIQTYHPDKFNHIQNILKHYKQTNDLAALQNLELIYLSKMLPIRQDFMIDYPEDYAISDDDFEKFGLEIMEEDYTDELEDDMGMPIERNIHLNTFYDALNEAVGGTEIYRLSEHDLHNLEGDIDLSDYHINDLDGADSCTLISGLNLSKNCITNADLLGSLYQLENLYIASNQLEDISFIENLVNLKELDISDNRINDLTPLKKLKKLKYLNVLGNNLTAKDTIVIEWLKSQEILVITA